LLSLRWAIGAQFIEQYLLWTFSGCWLLAAFYQQEVIAQTERGFALVAAD